MQIHTYAQLQQVQDSGGHFTLNPQGQLETQSAFRHLLQKVADLFRSITPGGRMAIAQRDAALKTAMDNIIRQNQIINPVKTEIPRPPVSPATPKTDDQESYIMAEAHDLAHAALSRRFPELSEEEREIRALDVAEKMQKALADMGLTGNVDRDLILNMVEGLVQNEGEEKTVAKSEENAPQKSVQAAATSSASSGTGASSGVSGMAEHFVNSHFAVLPQAARDRLATELKAHLAYIKLEERVPDRQAAGEVVEFCARHLAHRMIGRGDPAFAGLRGDLYAEPGEGRFLPLLELRAFANKVSPEGQMRTEFRRLVNEFGRRNFPGADEQSYEALADAVRENMDDMAGLIKQIGYDMNELRRVANRCAGECAQRPELFSRLVQRSDRPEKTISRHAVHGLTPGDIRPDTILLQGVNTCFMVSVLNSMMTTEKGRAMLQARLTADGTMPLDPEEKDMKVDDTYRFSALERSLAAAYQHSKAPEWRPGNMGVAPEFASLFGMREIPYRSDGTGAAQGTLADREDVATIRQHLEEGRMVLLFRQYHYRAVVGVEGDMLILRNSMRGGGEEYVRVSELVGGSISVMEYPESIEPEGSTTTRSA